MDQLLSEVIARNVRVRRNDANLTQLDVSERSQGAITRMALSTSEKGTRPLRIDELPGICHALGCSLTDLMEGYEDLPALVPATDQMAYGDILSPGPLATRLWPSLEPMVRKTIKQTLRESLGA